MLNNSFYQFLEIFKLQRLKFYLQLQSDVYLPEFTGSVVHSILYRAMQRYDYPAFRVFFKQYENQQPMPYALVTNEKRKKKWQKGEIFTFEIKLFGEAVNYKHKITHAIKQFGQQGLGNSQNNRAQYKLVSITTACRDLESMHKQSNTLIEHINPQLLSSKNFLNTNTEIQLQLNSPLRIQSRHFEVHQTPELLQLLYKINKRCQALGTYFQFENKDFFKSLFQNVPQNIRVKNHHHCYYESWQRYSKKQKEKLPFGGLLGQLQYSILDESKADILPWLAIGEQLQIGSKTTFGLGHYTLMH